jgi:hypothetical protein
VGTNRRRTGATRARAREHGLAWWLRSACDGEEAGVNPLTKLLRRLEKWPTSVSAFTAILSLVIAVVALVLQILALPPDKTPIVALVEREAALTKAGDVDGVVELYAPDAVVRDLGVDYNNNRPPREVQRWIGLERIRERYQMLKDRAVFTDLVHINITVTFDPETMARAISSTEGTMRWDGGPGQSITTLGARAALKVTHPPL